MEIKRVPLLLGSIWYFQFLVYIHGMQQNNEKLLISYEDEIHVIDGNSGELHQKLTFPSDLSYIVTLVPGPYSTPEISSMGTTHLDFFLSSLEDNSQQTSKLVKFKMELLPKSKTYSLIQENEINDSNSPLSRQKTEVIYGNQNLSILAEKDDNGKKFGMIERMDYNWMEKALYFSDNEQQKIFNVDMNGNNKIKKIVDLDNSDCNGLAVDPCGSKIYWINFRNERATLEQSSLTGSNRKTILSDQLFRPRSLIIKDKFIYWMDGLSRNRRGRGFKLERYNIDSETRETVCHSEDVTINPFSMDVSDSLASVYVTDWSSNAIWRLDLNITAHESCTLNVVYRLKNLRPMALSILPPLRGFLHQNCDNRSNIKNNRDNINKDPKDIGQKRLAILTPTLTKAPENSNKNELNSRINITQKNKMNIGPGTSANVANSSPISDDLQSNSVCTNYCFNYDSHDEINTDVTIISYSNSSCHITSLGIPFCHCQPGLSGSRCQINKCHNYCLNDGNCTFESNKPMCDCKSGYDGPRCQIEIQKIYVPRPDHSIADSTNLRNENLNNTTSNKVQFYLCIIYILASFIAACLILSIVFISIILCKPRINKSYTPVEAVSKEIKQSPPPHSPTVIKKSLQSARVFSASRSKSRSRSNNRKDKNAILSSCHDDESHKGHASLNSTNTSICCSTGRIDNLTHNGVVMDLEDCCQMTLCDTPCVEATFRKATKRRTRQDSLRKSMSNVENGPSISSEDHKNLLENEEICT